MFWNLENHAAKVKVVLRYGINDETVTLRGQWEYEAKFIVGKRYEAALQVLTDVNNGYATVTYELIVFDTEDGIRFFAFRAEQVKELWEIEEVIHEEDTHE